MPLQISPEVFKWLQGLGLVKEARRNQNNLMDINEAESSRLMDGFVFRVIFKSLFKNKADQQKLQKLESLKQNSTPAIRLYNWGILSQLLKQVGLILQPAEKSKITNYQPQPLAKVLAFLADLRAKDPTLKVSEQKSLKIDINQISKKSFHDATNTLELLTICISKHFKISPQQTLNLFLDNNKYFSHLLAKGVKNSFDPVYNLLEELRKEAEFIVIRLFCLDEEENVNFLFNALRTCLISKDQEVAHKCALFLLDIYDQYRLSNLNLQAIRSWVQGQGLNTLFFSIKKHLSLTAVIISICYSYLDDEFFKYIQLSQKSILWNTEKERFVFYKAFIEATSIQILTKFSITNYFEEWNRLFVKTMKKTKDKDQILLIIAIMEEQWSKMKQVFQQSQLGLPNQYINFLKTALMTPNQLLFLQATRTLFSLMQTLGTVKNPFAPLIFKILVTGYSTFTDLSKITFMSDNFIVSIQAIPSLPGTALVQPLLNHLQKDREWSMIELASVLIQEKRIDEEATLDLIEMMTKITFNDIRLGSIALDVIFRCLEQVTQENIAGFLENNTKVCLAQLYSLSKSISKSIKHLKEEIERMKESDENKKVTEAFVTAASKHILCKNMIGFIAKAIAIDSKLKEMQQSSIFYTYIKIKVQLKKQEQAELLRSIMASYYPEEEQLQAKIQQYMKEAYPPKPLPSSRSRNIVHSHRLSKSLTIRAATAEQAQKTIEIDPAQLKPSDFAIKDLQKLKQKRYELKTIEVQRQKLRILKEQKLQKFKTIQHQKRLVQSMSSIKNDVDYSHIQTIQDKAKATIQPQTHQASKQLPQSIRLLDIEREEQQAYREDVDSIIKRYKKVWKYLFFKYSLKKTEATGEDKVHMGEAWKMLKDYQFAFLKKQDVFTIVRLINQRLKRKNDIQYLNYQGFEDFILQASHIGFCKTGYPHLPPGKHLLMFVEQLKKITKEKSGTVQIFENPEESYFQQTEVIRQFNKRLKQNPDYILPEGYKKVKQTLLQFEYDFHPMLQKNIKQSYIDVMEVLDKIIFENSQLGFHILEPLSIKSETYHAKPFLFQSISEKMKDYSKGYLQPKKSITTQKDLITLPSPPKKKEFQPYVKFSLGIKLGIAQTSLRNRSIAEEVAYCMEDMLNAIENQSPIVKRGNKRKIVNDFLKRRRAEQTRIEMEKKKDEINWKKRAESVKLQVEALRKKRQQSEKIKKKKDFLDRKVKKEKEQRIYKEKMSQFEKVKAEIAQKKEALLQKKAIQQEKIKKEKEQYRQGVQEYFRKKKEELKEKEEDYKRKKQEQKYRKEEVEQQKKQFVKRLYLSNLKKEEQVLQKVDEIKQNYQDVWKSNEIQEVLTQHKKSLKLLFDLLLKYQKSKISATNYDEISLGTLNFFCLKFQIVPFMLQKQQIIKIFTYATKDEEDKKANRKGITFEKFMEVIFLISTKAKKMLNKMIEKRKKKQKRMQSFLNAQKSAGGNHFEAEQVDDSSSQSEQSDEEKPTLQDEYLFNAENVSEQTLKQVFTFLRLPSTKQDMEERYKEALEVKSSKPKRELVKEIKQSLQEL